MTKKLKAIFLVNPGSRTLDMLFLLFFIILSHILIAIPNLKHQKFYPVKTILKLDITRSRRSIWMQQISQILRRQAIKCCKQTIQFKNQVYT